MEDSRGLISNGSFGLIKSERLLSTTKKILNEIKPRFESIKIGNQEWMNRNLDYDRFRNGDLIPNIESDKEWEEAGKNRQPACCYYDNDPENGKKYGKLYNWYAVNDERGLAPEGYHIPTINEWNVLLQYLGEDIAGDKMKSNNGWEAYIDEESEDIMSVTGNNSSGFLGLPGGSRCLFNGVFRDLSGIGVWWSTSEVNNIEAWHLTLISVYSKAVIYHNPKLVGFSVRCLKD